MLEYYKREDLTAHYEAHIKQTENKNMTKIQYGMIRLESAIQKRKRKLISKAEYNEIRRQIEKQLFQI